MKTFYFKHYGQPPILIKNNPHSKALESVCLSRLHLPPIAKQSFLKVKAGSSSICILKPEGKK
jgi:hypothetical protein